MCSIERRLREGLLWITDKPPKMPILHKVLIVLGVGLFIASGIISLLVFLHKEQLSQNKELISKVSQLEQSELGYSGLLASCLNGHTLLDKTRDVALFTCKAIEVDVSTNTTKGK
jgi:hypothetical protein